MPKIKRNTFRKPSHIVFCVLTFLTGGFSSQALKADTLICPNVILKDGNLKLNANEKILVCGSDKSEAAWKEIPLSQSQFILKSYLQNRGYLNPRFEIEDQRLLVYAGNITLIDRFSVQGGTHFLAADKKRKVIDYPMEPKRLDQIDQWADLTLRRHGFACPQTNVIAQAWDGRVIAQVKPGAKAEIRKIDRLGYDGLDEAALGRFEAFKIGDDYNVIDTNITVTRLLADGLFQNAFITPDCHDAAVDLRLIVDKGKARIFRFGIGASTEEFPFVDLWYKDTLLDERASNYTASLHLSPILQRFNLTSELYVVPYSRFLYLGPRLNIEKRVENAYNIDKEQLGADLGRMWDAYSLRWDGRFGPTLNYEKTISGEGPDLVAYLTWDASLILTSHAYEAFLRDQYEGWTADLQFKGQRIGVGSKIDVDRYDVNFKYLWNIGHFSPPLFILATRLSGSAVSSNQSNSDPKEFPISYRIYYGGDDNLRGFSRQSLNNLGRGYSTGLYVGTELRLIEQLPYRLEPFLLWDYGKLGATAFTLDAPVFTSSGLGMRWASPIGTLRLLAARGQITNGNAVTESFRPDWIYFLSFGQEF